MLGCKGCTLGELGAWGVRLECMGVAWAYVLGVSGAQTGVWRAGVCAGRRLARRRAAVSAGVRLRVRRRVYCSPESTSFTRNHLNDLK
ncbi:hypothetical protein CDL15_Pgr008319 [Punica granatum]|uniref:Uncharacterized protein n=1 Tax=Punica granatum TaxID=22663 RepID=A0A218XSE5_PUNGR|nr:hypothetical protein CDL15_Pgr008319 [Punica granatum]PKI18426.1 hypothetical protein CRG98_049300 [Punica granatum]